MSLKDYEVERDHFEYLEYNHRDWDLCFPCCVCSYNQKEPNDSPCNDCDHNLGYHQEDQ